LTLTGGIDKRSDPPELVEGSAMVCPSAIAKAFGLDAATRVCHCESVSRFATGVRKKPGLALGTMLTLV